MILFGKGWQIGECQNIIASMIEKNYKCFPLQRFEKLFTCNIRRCRRISSKIAWKAQHVWIFASNDTSLP